LASRELGDALLTWSGSQGRRPALKRAGRPSTASV